jgi:hypothetical protein
MWVLIQSRLGRRLIAAAAAAIALLGVLLVLLLATLLGGLVPPSSCGPGAGSRYAPSSVALTDIPGNYLRWIRRAGDGYGLDWSVIAGIYSIETNFGRLDAPGVRSGENFAGAGGPGQFLAGTWRVYGVDGDRDGVKDRYNPADAIPGTANLLRQSGAPADYRRAVFAYNHASWYVDDVLARAARYRGAAEADPDAVQAVLVANADASSPCTEPTRADGPVDLNWAVRLTFPAAYRPLPAWTMATGRPPQAVDARIHSDVLWLLRRYNVRVTVAREAGHHTHGDGTAVDLVPAVGATQRDWDDTAGRLASDLGWTASCGRLRGPARLRAQAGDPVDRLRRVPKPWLAAHLPGRLPGAHPRLLGFRVLRLECARSTVLVGHGVPRARRARRRRESRARAPGRRPVADDGGQRDETSQLVAGPCVSGETVEPLASPALRARVAATAASATGPASSPCAARSASRPVERVLGWCAPRVMARGRGVRARAPAAPSRRRPTTRRQEQRPERAPAPTVRGRRR